MLNELFDRQAAIQTSVEKYAPIREVFEEFLKAGQREDAGFFWRVSPGASHSRFNWKRRAILKTASERKIVVNAFTDPKQYRFGWEAGDVQQALINVRVSLPENPTVVQEAKLPPVWAILEQDSDFSPLHLHRLEKDLEEIVPLVRALLPQS